MLSIIFVCTRVSNIETVNTHDGKKLRYSVMLLTSLRDLVTTM